MPSFDRESSTKIRFVPHPFFEQTDAKEQIESLEPGGLCECSVAEGNDLSTSTSPLGKLCEQPVLSRDEERYLFLRMNYEKFSGTNAKGKRRAEHLSLATAVRNRILMGNARLLVSIAGQFASPTVRTEDLVSEGVVPLLNAIELFDVSRGWAFGTYATHVLRNHFRRSGQRRQKRSRFAYRLNEQQIAHVPDEGVSAREQEELFSRHNDLTERCLAELSDVDRIILRTRFRFDDPASSKLRSFAEVGEVVGLSKERVRVRAHQALERLREAAHNRHWEFPELESLNLRA